MYCRGSRGRQAFVFARFPNNLGMIAFHVFQAIPFLYELRELLDWCVPFGICMLYHAYAQGTVRQPGRSCPVPLALIQYDKTRVPLVQSRKCL